MRAPDHAPAPHTGDRALWIALAILVAVLIGADAVRIGFFADDFHFLDVARRRSLGELLSGQYGIWPWYRPLSRELFFRLIVLAGPAGPAFAHLAGFACALACAWLTWRIGRTLIGAAAAAAGVAVFLANGHTKFLAAWASGFQDLLALFFVLVAVDAHLRGRGRIALLAAGLATFAKESAAGVFVLLPALAWLRDGPRPGRAWYARLAGVLALAAMVHLVVRLMWRSGGTTPLPAVSGSRLMEVGLAAVEGFVGTRPHVETATIVLAVLAGGCAALWLAASARAMPAAEAEEPRGSLAFLWIAAAVGAAPMIGGHVTGATFAHAYHAFPALPWVALLIGLGLTRLPGPLWRIGLPLLVAWNALAFAVAPVDLSQRSSWDFHGWSWREAVRFDAVTRRLQADVREALAVRPESLTVLYEGLPTGCFFQTEDGPATRETLRDPTVRTYWINDPPADVDAERLTVLSFDPGRFHLEHRAWSAGESVQRAMRAVMALRPRAARTFALYGSVHGAARFDRAYLVAAAALIEGGPDAYVAALGSAGLADTTGAGPATIAAAIAARDAALGVLLEDVLRRPRDARAHAALGRALIERGTAPRAGLELRLAVALDPARAGDRYQLAMVMVALGGRDEALTELRAIADDPMAGALAGQAREAIARLEATQPKP